VSEATLVNSDVTLAGYIRKVRQEYEEHRYLTYPAPRIGPVRSLDQNALLHVWLTEFAAELAGCHKKEVTRGMVKGIKRTMKEGFYRETGYGWMIHTVKCPLTGREKKDWSSSADYGRGEMFTFLSWLQMFAANHGCVLESKGQFSKLQKKQHAA
jgi:hypothetical protein